MPARINQIDSNLLPDSQMGIAAHFIGADFFVLAPFKCMAAKARQYRPAG